MNPPRNRWLLLAGAGSVLGALAHLACILGGPAWYRALGAGEGIARMAAQGHWYPTVVTAGIALVLGGWGFYAWSGAGLVRRLPLLRSALLAIAAIFLLRGVGFVFLQPYFPGNSAAFWFASSAICVALGLLYAVGLRQEWRRLSLPLNDRR